METIIKQALIGLDHFLENHLDDDQIELKLFDFYDVFSHEIKKWVGTSSGFTGLSEYLFFRFILLKFKQLLDKKFEPIKKTQHTWEIVFDEVNLHFYHDLSLKEFNIRPDISIVKKHNDSSEKLLAAFEIKTYISSKKIFKDLQKRFELLCLKTDAYLFTVLYSLDNQYTQEIENLYKICNDRIFVIGRAKNLKNTIGLKEAISKINSKLIY